mgnify:CR=1 FL=1
MYLRSNHPAGAEGEGDCRPPDRFCGGQNAAGIPADPFLKTHRPLIPPNMVPAFQELFPQADACVAGRKAGGRGASVRNAASGGQNAFAPVLSADCSPDGLYGV